MDDPAHRKIELQSPEDLTYLVDNVRRAAADSINAAFPPVDHPLDGQEDELRNQIEQLVNDVRFLPPPSHPQPTCPQTQLTNHPQYILKTFTLASPNLTINGLPLTNPSRLLTPHSPSHPSSPEIQYEYEPFDGRKRDRMEALISQEEDLLRSIAHLKRRVPQASAS
jgi:kinetochor protein Mis14/NSL1